MGKNEDDNATTMTKIIRCDQKKKNTLTNHNDHCDTVLNYDKKNAAIQIWFWGQSSLNALAHTFSSKPTQMWVCVSVYV